MASRRNTAPTDKHDDNDSAEFVAFEDFREGLPLGRFRVVINPDLARPFVLRRANALPIAIAIIGIGIASALGGYPIVGAVLVALGVVFRRSVRSQAPKILLAMASRQRGIYYDATTQGVMEVQRN